MTQPITWDKKSRKFLRVNGIPVPVASGSASTNLKLYGNDGENFENRPRRNQVGQYKQYGYTTTPLEISKAKTLQGLLNGEGSTWNFEEGFGFWSESGHWMFTSAVTSLSVFYSEFNFPYAPGYINSIDQSKFGSGMAYVPALVEPITTVRTGENGEWTVFGFYASAPSANGPHRYLWFGMNSEGESCWGGVGTSGIVSSPWIGTSQYVDGKSYVKIIVLSELFLDNFTALPFVVKPSEMVEIFKHSSQWDMRWGFALENGWDEPVSNCMISNTDKS